MAFSDFIRNLGYQNAPFGFDAMPMAGSPSQNDPAYNSGMQFVGDLGARIMANSDKNPVAAFGQAYAEAQGAARQRNKENYAAMALTQQTDDRRKERERQDQLTNRWSDFVQKNSSRFGDYAEIAPYLDPGEGMKLLSGMQPDWRPATAQEKAQYGVDPGTPLVIGQGGEPKILGGGGTTINMPPMETSYDKEMGGGLARGMLKMQEDKGNAQSALSTYDQMDANLNQPGVYTGLGGSTVRSLQQVGSALGITDPKIVANAEAFEAASNKAIKDEVGSLGAGVSEGDRVFVQNANAGLTRTKLGNKMIISMKRKIAQRKIQIADFAQEYAMNNGGRLDAGFYSALGDWSSSNPLFSPDEQQAILTASMQGRSAGSAVQNGKGNQEALPDISTMSDDDILNGLNSGGN